jgi:hypothetical protein
MMIYFHTVGSFVSTLAQPPAESPVTEAISLVSYTYKGSGVAKVAMARKLAVRMYWMLRGRASYAQLVRMQGSPWATLVKE